MTRKRDDATAGPPAFTCRPHLTPVPQADSAQDAAPAAGADVSRNQEAADGGHCVGDLTYRAYILLGIGNDDGIETLAESEHGSEQLARAWVEHVLPRTAFPEWVSTRRHGLAGAFLYGGLLWGRYIPDDSDVTWEPDPDQPCIDADIVNGTLVWIERS
jgi:hypothetical protein